MGDERRMNLKCYFAHPYNKRHTAKKYKIRRALEERKVDVLDPFIGEFKLLRKHNIKEYYEKPDYKVAREMWTKDLAQIRECTMFLCWLPHDSIGTSAELMYALEWQKRMRHQDQELPQIERRPYLIQIIAAKKHPLFAYALQFGNQQYETVEDFEKSKVMRW